MGTINRFDALICLRSKGGLWGLAFCSISHRSYNVVNELIVHSGIDKIITLIYLGIRGFIYEKYGFDCACLCDRGLRDRHWSVILEKTQ